MTDVLELGYRYVVPSVKRRLVEILSKKYGLSQRAIAKKLFISQSTVSRYLLRERGFLVNIEEYRDVDELIESLAKKVSENNVDRYSLAEDILRITLYVLGKGYMCKYHRMFEKTDLSKCRVCLRLFKDYGPGLDT